MTAPFSCHPAYLVLLLNDLLAPALHDCCDLGTSGGAGRGKKVAALAVQHACADSPLQCGNCVLACLQGIRVAENVGVLAYAYVDALALCVAVQDRCRLLAGDGCIRSERAVCVAGYDLVCRCPADRLRRTMRPP